MKLAVHLALLGFALGVAGAAVAQSSQDATSPTSTGTMAAHQTADPQQQMARLSRKLQLTPAQTAKIEPILQTRQQELQQLRGDTSMSPSDRHAKMHSIMQDSSTQLQSVLTDSQKQQYQQMMQQAMQHRQDKKGSSDDSSGG